VKKALGFLAIIGATIAIYEAGKALAPKALENLQAYLSEERQ
jgi:hypothetical protein